MDIQQIQDLIRKYNAGLCTAEEKSLLEQWYLSFEWDATPIPFNEKELAELKNKTWQSLSKEKNNHGLLLGEPAKVIAIHRKRRYWWYAAAACLAFVFFATWKWWPDGSGKVPGIVYQQQLVTQKGSRSQMLLPDGSKVWLNAGSKLDYPEKFNSKTRDVQLQGEAYFEVMKDSEKPFFVHTNSFDIKVLGTGFNVRAYPDEDSAVTALVHGSVEVIVGKKEKRTILLRPNEKITLPMNTGIGEAEKAINNTPGVPDITIVKEKMAVVEDTVQSETAWINNKLAFKKMALENVALLLEKWFDADIRFKNEDRKALHFTGVYTTETLDEILYTLEATGTFHYEKDSNGLIWIE
ncbi:MAG TPA: FecR domain-containing protein [Chitinophagaceae bacterium]|nr:FecR domain-containing protein [Chitinophagaceae bacterium]